MITRLREIKLKESLMKRKVHKNKNATSENDFHPLWTIYLLLSASLPSSAWKK
jgi:hypothetical protein